jgi:hypothetical protein
VVQVEAAPLAKVGVVVATLAALSLPLPINHFDSIAVLVLKQPCRIAAYHWQPAFRSLRSSFSRADALSHQSLAILAVPGRTHNWECWTQADGK